jgi:hypothetical protein
LLTVPAEILVSDRLADGPPVRLELRPDDGDPVTVEGTRGDVHARRGAATNPDLVIAGPHRAIVRLLAGALRPPDAASAGLRLEGDEGVLGRLDRPGVAP